MEYIRITGIDDPYFDKMHKLMQAVFPEEEVLEATLWAEPLRDPSIRVCVAVHEDEVVGATEYRYLAGLQVAMTDFTIIGRSGLGVGRFLWTNREADLRQMAAEAGGTIIGMFAEVYDPGRAAGLDFGNFPLMHPVVRREVLSHLGYQRLDFPYLHPSWQNDGAAVAHLDLCFLPSDPAMTALPSQLVVDFLTTYYAVLPNKPKEWQEMVDRLRTLDVVPLRPL
jgi:hypothetical protein